MNKLRQDQQRIRQDWQAVGDTMRTVIHTLAGGDAEFEERASIAVTAAPDEDDLQLPLAAVVQLRHGLPLSSRSVGQMLADYATDAAFQASSARSIERRTPPQHPNSVVIRALDAWSDMTHAVGTAAMEGVDYQTALAFLTYPTEF